MRLEFKKDDGVKYIDKESKLIPRLLKDGWKCAELAPKRGRPAKKVTKKVK